MARLSQAGYDALAQRLGYLFKDRALIDLALTHPSNAASENDYQRLEFLGDRVLGLVIAEELYRRNPDLVEGRLSPLHSQLVRREACAEAAGLIGLQDFVQVGEREATIGVNAQPSVLADAMEAVIAAVYLDGGLEAARSLIVPVWDTFLNARTAIAKDAKTFLQEWALGRGLAIPAYKVTGRRGPDHAPTFEIEVRVDRHEPAMGSGASKRLAEQAAAAAFIGREGLRP